MARILVIDDHVTFRVFLREVLIREGYDVKESSTGKDGLRSCRVDHVPLVVTDILMPDMDGLEFIQELRRVCPQTKIVAISGGYQWSGPSMLEVAKRLGADLAFEKPFDMETFLQCLRELSHAQA